MVFVVVLTARSFKNDFFFIIPAFTLKSYTYSNLFFILRQHTVQFTLCRQSFFFMISNFDSTVCVKGLFFDYFRYLCYGLFMQPFDKIKFTFYGAYQSFFFSTATYALFFNYFKRNYNFMYFCFFNIFFRKYFKFFLFRLVELNGVCTFNLKKFIKCLHFIK